MSQPQCAPGIPLADSNAVNRAAPPAPPSESAPARSSRSRSVRVPSSSRSASPRPTPRRRSPTTAPAARRASRTSGVRPVRITSSFACSQSLRIGCSRLRPMRLGSGGCAASVRNASATLRLGRDRAGRPIQPPIGRYPGRPIPVTASPAMKLEMLDRQGLDSIIHGWFRAG